MSESPTPQYRCHDCKSTSVNPRNLVLFIDGTSNKPGPEKTNVIKLYEILSEREPEQHKFYLEGIGVHEVDHLSFPGRMGKAIYSGFEMALAWNVEKNVKKAYRWLAQTYKEGDQIYLFGFSRGAYQVRALAGIIHEVGLVREESEERIDQAYRRYLSIDPNLPQTRQAAIQFKQLFCWPGVRIHFMGVWDTVSSLGLVKRDVHITASASVTNACHFRHALALDERRVKFIPEYFLEMNAHRTEIKSPRLAVSDVQEIWFAGCHGDVGGTSRPDVAWVTVPDSIDNERYPIHSGNVPLQWMRHEAAAQGLVFKSEAVAWCPEDVDLGRKDSMNRVWKFFEILPFRHQVSFSGTGKHKLRRHLSRPRLIIPDQQIHFSIFSGDVYSPRATLCDLVDIPTVPQGDSNELSSSDPPDEGAATRLLGSLLSSRNKMLESLERVLFLLQSRLDNGLAQAQTIPNPQWLEMSIHDPSCPDKFAFTVVYDIISNFSIPEELLSNARDELVAALSSPNDQPYSDRTLAILRFSARHETLRRRYIAHEEVAGGLMHALERTVKDRNENLFVLVMDSLYYLVNDDNQGINVINQLTARSDATGTGQTRLLLALEAKAPSHLIASLKMVTSLAQHQPNHHEALEPKILELAKKTRGPVGSAAVEALVALNVPLTGDIHFSNILGYLGSTLPRLDAEVGNTSSLNGIGDLPPILRVGVNGSVGLNEEVMRKLVQTIGSRDAHQRITATLTFLKLCRYSMVREFCSQNNVLDIFMKQLGRKETSLLAAYALEKCLKHNMWTSDDFPRAAQRFVNMLDKGWFDDAVGRVEGSKVFGELMTSDNLRKEVVDRGALASLERKLKIGDPHETRMSLICLNILRMENAAELPRIVAENLALLTNKDRRVQKKAVKTLSSLAQTAAGEQAVLPHLSDILAMLLPPQDGSPLPRSQLFGPSAVVYGLCKNETLRERILASDEYATFKRLRGDSSLYPQT